MSGEGIRYRRGGFTPNRWMVELAAELSETEGRRIPKNDLLAMSPNKDPFNKGTEGDFEKAEWFERIFRKYGYHGIHNRKLHYRFLHAPDHMRVAWDGQEYLNTETFLNKMNEASAVARILGLVDRDAIIDSKAETPLLYDTQNPSDRPEPDFELELPEDEFASVGEGAGWPELPNVRGSVQDFDPSELEHEVAGLDYSPELQPCVIEIWSEKGGDDSTLRYLARHYDVNYVPGVGFASHTTIKNMLKRLQGAGRPGLVLYVSDFDPAGAAMPKVVGRHTQLACWEIEEIAYEAAPAIKIENTALTREQVQEHDLPRIPIKTTDTRKAKFELMHGEGATEIDALEAIRPGELRRILSERIERFRDETLPERVAQARREGEERTRNAIEEVLDDHRPVFEDILDRAREIEDRYAPLYDTLNRKVRPRYERLGQRYDRHMDPLREELEEAEAELRDDLENLEVDLPALPKAEPENASSPQDADGWLFDSKRDWLKQTQIFRKHAGLEQAKRAHSEKTCVHCGEKFVARKAFAKYCTPVCGRDARSKKKA